MRSEIFVRTVNITKVKRDGKLCEGEFSVQPTTKYLAVRLPQSDVEDPYVIARADSLYSVGSKIAKFFNGTRNLPECSFSCQIQHHKEAVNLVNDGFSAGKNWISKS